MARHPSRSATGDAFIVATGGDDIKPDAQTRKFIRSQVMRGKNKGKKGRSETAQVCDPLGGPLNPSTVVAASALAPSPARMMLAVQMDPSFGNIVQNFVLVMRRAMYPIERCIGVGTHDPCWFQTAVLYQDTAYTHTVAYAALAYFDIIHQNPPRATDWGRFLRQTMASQQALVHINKGIRLLRERIAPSDFVATDATIFLVLALGLFAEAQGELDAAQKHLLGLYQLVQLRGGITSLADKRFLQIKCCRLDLAVALRTGRSPLFFSGGNDLSWEVRLARPYQEADTASPIHALLSTLDPRLVNVWRDLRTFIVALNLAHESKDKIAPDLFQEVLITVHYRLHRLSKEHSGCSEDDNSMLQLAMLAFSTTIFLEVHSDSFRLLASKTKSMLEAWHIREQMENQLAQREVDEMLKLHLWIAFVVAVSVLDGPGDHAWLRQKLRMTVSDLGLTSWTDARTILKQFLWVDAVNDAQGKEFFLSLPV